AAPRDAEIRKDVQDYYGQVLKTSADLQTNACVTPDTPVPEHIRQALRNVHEEVTARYYGCGLVIPECLENCWILDLGSGSGRDCYVLSQLVGEKGHVTGIDMTESQVEVAKNHLHYHMEKFGFQTSNVTFLHGCIERLAEAGIQNESYDIVECLGGALHWRDLAILAQKIGFCPPRLVTAHFITIQNTELQRVTGDCRFVSATYRLFKLPKTEPAKRCQVVYNGGITGHEKELIFDANFTFKEGEVVEVDGETAALLKNSRFAQDFLFRPSGATLAGSPALESKDVITDPFKLAEDFDKMKPKYGPAAAAGGCCGKKKNC
uniref:Arsenite methyltransferase n=1 Tax=Jaculus jaculus TaxID=51337 RepID=A0A8C5KXA9_JACJA